MLMKTKLFILPLVALLMIGCKNKQSKPSSIVESSDSISESEVISSDTSESSDVSSSESEEPISYGYNHYNSYYGSLKWEDGEDLKQKLHDIIRTGFNSLNYNSPNWETNTIADHSFDDFEYLDVIYSEDRVLGSATNKLWQREHAFPASLMTGSLTQEAVKNLGRATDFHNLFASAASANSSRGNKNYGYADKEAASYQDKTTNNGLDGYSFDEKTFEPGDIDKGRVARAIFYMCTMYKDDEVDSINHITMKGLKVQEEDVTYPSQGIGYDAFAIGHVSDLLTWADTFDVDYLEMQHNDSVYSHPYSKSGLAQNNRNPYVDYPELVDYVFGDKADESGDLQYLKPSSVALELEQSGVHHYAIQEAKRNYNYGENLSFEDLIVTGVGYDFALVSYQGEYEHSLEGHTFSEDDGKEIEASITVEEQTIKYVIELDSMENCNHYIPLNKGTIDRSTAKIGVDQSVTYGNVNFTINITALHTDRQWTLTNIGTGGFTMGSKDNNTTGNPVKKVVLTTVNEFNVDEIYIRAKVNNNSSSYNLKILVGTTEVYSGKVNDSTNWNTFGGGVNPLTGKISYVFEGESALCLLSLAFNEVTD